MIDKSDINTYINDHLDDFSSMKTSDFIHQCFNDLSDQWVSAGNGDNLVDNQLCWVLMPSGEVMVMRFNSYIKFGGLENCWQDLAGVDYLLDGTKYIEIKKPEPPK